ncbi:MAG: hypothetical protein ABIU58_11890 [Ramlibacter sp.]
MSSPPDSLPAQVQEALRRGNVMEAIKLLRASGNFGLKEAKELLEAHQRGAAGSKPPPPRAAATAPGTIPPSVADAMQKGNKLEAIGLLRQQAGLGLKEAREAIELQAHVRATPGGLSPGQVPDSTVGRWVTLGILLASAIALVYFLAGCAAINFGNPILAFRDSRTGAYPTHFRALRHIRIHGLNSLLSPAVQLI